MDTAEFKGLSGCVNNEIIFNNKMKTITADVVAIFELPPDVCIPLKGEAWKTMFSVCKLCIRNDWHAFNFLMHVLEDFPFGQPTELFHELAYFLDKAIEHSLNDFQFFFLI